MRKRRRKNKNGEVKILSPSSISISSKNKKSPLEREKEILKGLQNPENPTALLDSRQFELEAEIDRLQEQNEKFGFEEGYKTLQRVRAWMKKREEEEGEDFFDEGYIPSERRIKMLTETVCP